MEKYMIGMGLILMFCSCTQKGGGAGKRNGKPAEPEITVCKG